MKRRAANKNCKHWFVAYIFPTLKKAIFSEQRLIPHQQINIPTDLNAYWIYLWSVQFPFQPFSPGLMISLGKVVVSNESWISNIRTYIYVSTVFLYCFACCCQSTIERKNVVFLFLQSEKIRMSWVIRFERFYFP